MEVVGESGYSDMKIRNMPIDSVFHNAYNIKNKVWKRCMNESAQ